MTGPRGIVDPGEVARSYLDAFSSGDPEAIAADVSEDFVNEHTSALGTGCIGKAAYLERLPSFLEEMADLRYAVESLVIDGHVVAAFYTMTARWQGSTPISIRGVQRLTIKDGYIVHRTDYWDSASFLMQVDTAAKDVLTTYGCS